MISDASALADGSTLTADVCIVGGGPAGITLALALRNAGLSVLLLESGGLGHEPASQALNEGRQSGIDTWKLAGWRARLFGGTSWWWAGLCRPLSPEDFEARSWVPGGGWPLRYEDLVPYYERAHETVEIGPFLYDPAVLSAAVDRPLLPFGGGVIETRVYQFSTTQFGIRYRDDLAAAPDVRVLLHANLRKIHLANATSRTVSHLECATLEGLTFRVEAGRYVLAAGGIENARVLLASNDERPEGIANSSGSVGRFMEHPHYYQALAMLWSKAPDLRFYEKHTADLPMGGKTQTVPLLGGLALTAAVRASERLPNFTATLDPVALDDPTGTIDAPTAAALLGRDAANPSLVRLTCRCEQTATDASRITLTNDVDAIGMRRVDLHWALRPEDSAAMQRSSELLGRELGRLGLGRIWTPAADLKSRWTINPGGHHLGTTRMSADPSEGVVDGNGRTHDVDNLFLTGGSVFATGGDANPTLTIVALAHRLADHLKGAG